MSEKKSTVGAVCFGGQDTRRELSFEEILLDETLVQGDIWVLKKALCGVGGINYRLSAKRNYELIIRIAREYTVWQIGARADFPVREEDWVCLKSDQSPEEDERGREEGLKTDCYLIGRYKEELLSMGCFDDAVLGVVSDGKESMIQYLKQMIAATEEFQRIYDCTQPILIYAGRNWVHNLADMFAGDLGRALEELGQCVEYSDINFDTPEQQSKKLNEYTKRRFKAVIGMGADVLFLKRRNGRFVHDDIAAPKYYFYFDHPIWTKELRTDVIPCGLCVLALDRNYVKFMKKYFGHSARFLPPAGKEEICESQKREYEITLLGRYYGTELIEILREIGRSDKKWGYLLNRYVLNMRKDLSIPPEDAFRKALEYYGMAYTKQEFIQMFHTCRRVFVALASYYRNKVVETLLEAGIVLHVFGDTWKASPMWGHPGLICHEAVSGEEALKVYGRSKLSLNVMMWHKDAFTERIANAMLQKSVVVTDRTAYLQENFVSGEELLIFDLKQIKELPGQIKELLENEEKRKRIAENGYRKAVQLHTWRQRAEKILEFIEEDSRKRSVEDEGFLHHNSSV